jgi:prepilin-type N-terminal cleavage/methylation domain-containing protein
MEGYPHNFLILLVLQNYKGIYFLYLQKIEKIMSNTFKKTSVRGFTLIELLVVIAIIGLLSTIIAAPIQSARKKARDAKKIAELKSTQLALEQYAESNSAQYPTDLQKLSPQFMPLLPTFATSSTSNARDAFLYTFYTASSTGATDQIFAYHFGVKLEVYGPALETDRDCISATLSASLTTPFCAVYNGNAMTATFVNNGSNMAGLTYTAGTGGASTTLPSSVVGGLPVVTNGRDFEAKRNPAYVALNAAGNSPMTEESSSTCVSVTDCIFDVTSQQ